MKANNRVDGMEIRFDRIDTRLDGMDARFDGIDEALNWQGEMLKVHGASLGAIETTQASTPPCSSRYSPGLMPRVPEVETRLRHVTPRGTVKR